LANLYSLDLSYNPDLKCWETQDALNWALSLYSYIGPKSVCGVISINIPLIFSVSSNSG
jgi:hypothetical protein